MTLASPTVAETLVATTLVAATPLAATPLAAHLVTAPDIAVITDPDAGIETDEPCDLCDSLIRAGTTAAVLLYVDRHAFAHAECIDELSRPTETARLI